MVDSATETDSTPVQMIDQSTVTSTRVSVAGGLSLNPEYELMREENASLKQRLEELALKFDSELLRQGKPQEVISSECSRLKERLSLVETTQKQSDIETARLKLEVDTLASRLHSRAMHISAQKSLIGAQTDTIEDLTKISMELASKKSNTASLVTEHAFRTIEEENRELREEAGTLRNELIKCRSWLAAYKPLVAEYHNCVEMIAQADDPSFDVSQKDIRKTFVQDFLVQLMDEVKGSEIHRIEKADVKRL
ncbi:hypothetical protein HDU67_003605 [Dinochytrium kinnereticum]|nr:hypothetical protein HDU67_003605 [Dinochytrium kinnereticum]